MLPVARELLQEGGVIAALLKLQFEAGKEKVGKKGVVREPAIHREVIENVLSFSHELGFAVKGLTFSPVKGPEGNIEYLAWLLKDRQAESSVDEGLMDEVVREAHAALDK